MRNDHSERATIALRKLSELDPAFASLALWCQHRDDDADGPPAWTNGRAIFYGIGFAKLAPHEQVGLAAHQILHVAFCHARRSRAMWSRFGDRFDAEIYNIATDAIVNQTLLLAEYPLPRPCVLLTELLGEAFGETVPPEQAIGAWDAEKLYIRLIRAAPGDPAGRRSRDGGLTEVAGRTAAERARTYALRNGFGTDLRPSDSGAEATPDAREAAEWRQRLTRALDAGRLAGRGIGALGHRLADLPRSDTRWEIILRAMVTKAVAEIPRRSWQRPTRRWIARDSEATRRRQPQPPFEPGTMRTVAVPRIAICVDASGSIDTALLALFAAQVAGIGRRTGAEVHVFVFDDGVRSHTRMRGRTWEAEISRVAFSRGGGTSFVEVLGAAEKIAPSVIVVLTDLDGPFGAQPGRIPVIWAVPDETRCEPPPFGRILSLSR